ncbi:probable peptidyl-tRNA hydrolase 2 [Stomoxys calcitrans]|uniref:peptidyl-tRNA hydrolase n=1 Tax=Stomoxys calcitrans TaxID=35570 RepID=A0A1I8Q4C4_STOCA|nr:probable peptidyl-tRNA hydrolase 2 [Stomoxys calcitrans]
MWSLFSVEGMADRNLLDTTNIVNGVAILLSFFIGYKYALKRQDAKENQGAAAKLSSDEDTAAGSSVEQNESVWMNNSGNYKMVLVVRNDLKMGKGKVAAQCGHGAVGAYQNAVRQIPSVVRRWENTGCAKVALKVESEAEMMALKRAADRNNLITCLIRDAGRTQIEPNSKTVLAIGPAPVEKIDQVTGHLKLL